MAWKMSGKKFVMRGILNRAAKLISSSRRPETTTNYQSAWKNGLAGVVSDRLIQIQGV